MHFTISKYKGFKYTGFKYIVIILVMLVCSSLKLNAQDTTFNVDGQKFTLTDAIVRNHFDYKDILQKIKEKIF